MASIEDLEAGITQADVIEDEFEADGFEELAQKDMQEAFSIMEKASTLLKYIADPDLYPRLLKRDRATLAWVAETIDTFVAEAKPHYEEEEE